MRGTVSTALRMMLMLNVPATIGLIVLAQPIVELLLDGEVPAARHGGHGGGADVLRARACSATPRSRSRRRASTRSATAARR